MPKREDWVFTFTAEHIMQASSKKRDSHAERLTYWKKEFEEAKADLKENFIEIEEQAVLGTNYSNSYQQQAVGDPKKSRRFQDAAAKVKEHENLWVLFNRWCVMMESEPKDRPFELDYNDIMTFGLAD